MVSKIFGTPKVDVETVDPLPTVTDEESRRAAELERRKRGKGGRQSTILAQSSRLGLPTATGRISRPNKRPTVLGS